MAELQLLYRVVVHYESVIEMLEAVQMGTLDMSIASTPSLSGFTDCMNYFDLPYLFKATDSAWSVMDEWLGQDRCEALEGSGFKGLGFYDNGEYMIGSNKKLVHPEGRKGAAYPCTFFTVTV